MEDTKVKSFELEIKNIISERRIYLEAVNCRLEIAEENFSRLEGIQIENIQNKAQSNKRRKWFIRDLWEKYRWFFMMWRKLESEGEEYLKKERFKIFQIWKLSHSKRALKLNKYKQTTLWHMIIKLVKTSDKEIKRKQGMFYTDTTFSVEGKSSVNDNYTFQISSDSLVK